MNLEEVYIEIPLSLGRKTPTEAVCKLKKSLDGLKQSPRAWFDRVTQAMKKFGYNINVNQTILCSYRALLKVKIDSYSICR